MRERTPQDDPDVDIDPILLKFNELFDFSTVFIPLRVGEDQPPNDQWKGITLEQSHASDYVSLLGRTDLAVVCGPASGQLCALQFMEAAALDEFKELNPTLKTLITQHPDGTRIWYRID